ncbi:hypothetical protein GN244_ATG16249 [Phytophthora infestans]|uniref:HTH CENPB-type domain-containing protein n=1 Tax=Phytophthora infestans TaxID=4787 RepID=A0A833STK7_PHYIN|nr:hypothetical protein GN244_ATG16249 [Phytophthora infestans]
MPSSRMPKSMAEKKAVAQWIEKNGGVPTPSAVYFKNERGYKVSEAQVRYWWKQRTAIKAAPALRSRLTGAGAKPPLSEIEDILFDQVLFCRSAKEKVFLDWIRDAGQRHLSWAIQISLRRTAGSTASCVGMGCRCAVPPILLG